MNMIERVARQLRVNSGMNQNCPEYWRMLAKAAIAAMREPTDEMISNVYLEIDGSHRWREVWKIMIDAALTEEKK